VETNTTHSIGDCTLASKCMAAWLKAAGFEPTPTFNVCAPENLPLDEADRHLAGPDAGSAIMLLAHLMSSRPGARLDPRPVYAGREGKTWLLYARGCLRRQGAGSHLTDTLIRLKQAGARPKRTKLVLSCGGGTDAADQQTSAG
jgi:hypothetical protein